MSKDWEPVRIVGVGASAGGLESLEKLFASTPGDLGMAFVIVQHLSPNHKSLMTELLARHSAMPVQRAEDGEPVHANHVYLLPPGKEIMIRGGRLALTDKDPEQALTLPIDRFFRSLAHDAGPRAIAIVLSGSGSDGSRGIVEVKRGGGLVLAESAETANFDGMPMSARATGAVDHVCSPQAMARVLMEIAGRPSPEPAPEPLPSAMAVILGLLREAYGIDFSDYRPSTVTRRLERRLALRGHNSLETYADELQSDGTELAALYQDLLIGVTQFFRDPDAFAVVERSVIPLLLQNSEPGAELRMWIAGCATGEEAYSLAMILFEQLTAAGRPVVAKIIATDVDRRSLDFASAGVYDQERLRNVSPERLARFFVKRTDGYQVSKDLRQLIVFAPHNVVRDAPFTRMHLISCRNLLIYLEPPAQKAVLSLFHFGLAPTGVLMLGSSESPGGLAEEFTAIDDHWKIYRKRRDVRLLHQLRLPLSRLPGRAHEMRTPSPDTHLMPIYDRLLDRYMPPSLLVDENRTLLDTFAGAERWLRLKGRRPSRNLLDLLEPESRTVIAGAIARALKESGVVRYTGVRLHDASGPSLATLTAEAINHRHTNYRHVLLTVTPAQDGTEPRVEPAREGGRRDSVDAARARQEGHEALEDELAYTRETLQAAIEELETSNEELQATNEELIASNEELQSTNEELHSVNEELYTVNAEHQKKIEELRELNNDMQHLIEGSDIGTLFLDRDLRIRRYTPRIADVFRILPQDVGRRIDDFSHEIDRPNLVEDMERVLLDGVGVEAEVRDLRGTPYFLRILPYRSGEGLLRPENASRSGDAAGRSEAESQPEPDGVVITLTDISMLTRTRSRLASLSAIVESSDDAIIGIGLDGEIRSWNPGARRLYGYTAEEAVGRSILSLSPTEEVEVMRDALATIRLGRSVEQLHALRVHRDGYLLIASATVSPVLDERGVVEGGSVIARDVSALWRAQRDAQERQELVRLLLDSTAEAIYGLDPNGRCSFCNRACATLLGYDDPRELIGEDMHALHHCVYPDGTPYPAHECPIQTTARRGESVHRSDEVFVRTDGTTFSVEYRSHPLRRGNDIIGSVVTFLDITERKLAEQEMRVASQRREQFLAMLSHELRNPLAAVLNATSLLRLKSGDSPDQATQARRVVERQTRHMARLLDDLLDVSRITSGKFQLREEACDLREAIVGAIESIAPQLAAQRIDLHRNIPAEPIVLLGDSVRLQQVVANLLSNAVRHSEPGGRVELTVRCEDGHARFSLRDHGTGIHPELLPKIFDLFVQSDQHIDRSRGGLGVGLTLVKRIVELHGGTVQARSDGPGRGSEFVVRLPLAADRVAERPERGVTVSGGCRIVLVEDQADAREMLSLLLTARGHEVVEAVDGAAAIEHIERVRPDAALVDIGLPTMSGYEVARRIRENPTLDSVVLVALTGYGTHADIEAAIAAGFDEHLTKPVETERLEAILARCIQPRE
jgi:two-component system, chemotaxis family, CheB/CheR fusion protein